MDLFQGEEIARAGDQTSKRTGTFLGGMRGNARAGVKRAAQRILDDGIVLSRVYGGIYV